MIEEVIGEVVEQVRLVRREHTRVNLIDCLLQLRKGLIELSGDITMDTRKGCVDERL